MGNSVSRRTLIRSAGGGALALVARKVWAQPASGGGTLDRLRAAGTVNVGIADDLPFSGPAPDGTPTGLGPTLAQAIMAKLGVPAMTASVAAYGELIPGMQAGRWAFVAGLLSITKQRCDQVLFSDPVAFDGSAIVSLRGSLPNPPRTLADIVRQNLVVGSPAGGQNSRMALEAGVSQDNLRQFPDNNAIVDGLVAGRIQVAFGAYSGLARAYKARNVDFEVVYPVADSLPPGSGNVFRREDPDFHAAFQAELRAMKKSGAYLEIARSFGFDTPANLIDVTAQEACGKF